MLAALCMFVGRARGYVCVTVVVVNVGNTPPIAVNHYQVVITNACVLVASYYLNNKVFGQT